LQQKQIAPFPKIVNQKPVLTPRATRRRTIRCTRSRGPSGFWNQYRSPRPGERWRLWSPRFASDGRHCFYHFSRLHRLLVWL